MLVLTRKKGESIILQNNIEIIVLSTDGDTVKLGISAPKDVDIYRKEVFEAIQHSNKTAVIDVKAFEGGLQYMQSKEEEAGD
ncbi:carbon storage regulator CsrA [Paenibacillus massiliensis]|uniref:carbon storage regulator CsrA n=1 Tax=Paenibacillus massiliensis TaxID=225917 RepID=UPI0004703F71|nr:carbon storage regulator CsrA [Paenibacillus massiliensis]